MDESTDEWINEWTNGPNGRPFAEAAARRADAERIRRAEAAAAAAAAAAAGGDLGARDVHIWSIRPFIGPLIWSIRPFIGPLTRHPPTCFKADFTLVFRRL